MIFRLSDRSKERRADVDERLIEISDLAITLTLVDFGHPEFSGRRSAEEQNQLHLKGLSECDGYANKSNHQTGHALDFYAYVDGRASWERHHLAMVACAFLQAASILGYKIQWGGLWRPSKPINELGIDYGWDCPHVELLEDDV